MIDGDDPAQQLLNQAPDDEEIEIGDKEDVLEGSIKDGDDPAEKAGTEKDHPQGELDLDNPDDAD